MLNLKSGMANNKWRRCVPHLISVVTIATICTSIVQGQPCDPTETDKLVASGWAYESEFGFSVAVAGDTAVVGADENDDKGDAAGAVFIYRFDGFKWTAEARLHASDASTGDNFGYDVALSNDVVVVGTSMTPGSAYVFRYDGGGWVEEAKLMASDGEFGGGFGNRIAIENEVIAVGAYWDDENGTEAGSVYVFRFDGTAWIKEAKLLASDSEDSDRFGRSVGVSGNTILVGASFDDDNGENAGTVYVFEYDGSQWAETDQLRPSSVGKDDRFGDSLALEGNTAAIGAYNDDAHNSDSGSVFVYRHDGARWVEEARLLAGDGKISDYLGRSVALSGNTIVAGAWGADAYGDNTGAAYVFHFDGTQWDSYSKFLASDAAEDSHFGYGVGVSGDRAIIGAPLSEQNGIGSGAAYVFNLGCSCLDLRVDNLVAGEQAVFSIAGGTPNQRGVTVYGTRPGETELNGYAGFCATFGIAGVNQNKVIGGLNRTFDVNGVISFNLTIPGSAGGIAVLFQAAQNGTCPDECVSNLIEAVIQ